MSDPTTPDESSASEATEMSDGVQPIIAPDMHEDLVLRAAEAVAGLIPSAEPLMAQPESQEAPTAEAPALYSTFTGTASGTVVLILADATAAALQEADESAADILGPVLATAAEVPGPAVLDGVIEAATGEIPGVEDTVFIAVGNDSGVAAWVGLSISGLAGASPPSQRQPEGTGQELAAMGTGSAEAMRMEVLRGVEMELAVEIGRAKMLVKDLLNLVPGTVVELDRAAGAPADLRVNGRLIARGEVVVVDEEFGLRITQLISDEQNSPAP